MSLGCLNNMIRSFMLGALMAVALGAAASAQDTAPSGPEVTRATGGIVRGLDTVTGQTRDFDLQSGESARLGRLTITLGECRYPTEDPASNAYGWLTVLDDVAAEPVFQGWMIAAAPALSALDHPRYDVWLIRCNISDG